MRRRNTAIFGLGASVLGIATVIFGFWGRFVLGSSAIWTAGDGWNVIHPARFVASGAFPYLYSPYFAKQARWPYPPGLPVLFAPVAWLIDRLGLSVSEPPLILPRATGWFVLAPALVFVGAVMAPAVAGLARRLGARCDISAGLLAATAGGFSAAVLYGHAEDIVAVTALVGAVGAALDARWRRVGVLLGVALLFKQWAFVLVPLLLSAAPPAIRRGLLLRAVVVPGVPILVCLLYDPRNTVRALTGAQSAVALGHAFPWIPSSSALVTAAPLRVVGLVVLAVLGWCWGRRCQGTALVAAAGGLMALRLLTEPVLFSYYLAQIAPFVLVVTAARSSRAMLWAQGLGLAALSLWFAQHPSPWVWWPVAAALASPSTVVLLQARRAVDPTAGSGAPRSADVERCVATTPAGSIS